MYIFITKKGELFIALKSKQELKKNIKNILNMENNP